MYYKFKSNVLFRKYKNYGYITDDRNYRYIKDEVIGDRVVSESGAIFLSTLSKIPKSIFDICENINKKYQDIDINLIKNDVEDFFYQLVFDGFLCRGETAADCNNNDYFFSYKKLNHKIKRNTNEVGAIDTADFFENNDSEINRLSSVHIEITSKCNERCIHCYIPHENKIKTLNIENIYDVLEQCKNMNVLHIVLSGGEPLLHKNFYSILRKCREYNFAISILTNLTLLTDEIVDEMRLNGSLGVQTSLYSMDPAIHDSITKMTGSYKKTKSSILKLIENDIPLQISCPIMKQNKDCYNDVIEWAKEIGISASDDYALIAEYDHSNQNLCNRLSLDEVNVVIENKSLTDKNFIKDIENKILNNNNFSIEDPVCTICKYSVCIAENGNVYPCAGWQDYILGNILEESLNDIWNFSKKINSLRKLKKKDFPKCIKCDLKGICSMCMVRNANEDKNGNYLKVNEYFCKINELTRDFVNKKEKVRCISK